MKKPKQKSFTHIANVITIALIIECFLCSFMVVSKYSRENCFDRIQETTGQVGTMFRHAMEDNQNKLTVFANILGANSSNTDEYLQRLMNNFCKTQNFTAACIHRADGSTVYMGNHPHETFRFPSYQEEIARLPYTSGMISRGDTREEKYVYQAVPVVRDEKTVGILYGYLSLADFPDMVETTAYDGGCHFGIVDGDTGDYLMDDYHDDLSSIYDERMDQRESKKDYDVNALRTGIHGGKSGYYVSRSAMTGVWHYTYYQPLGINNWCLLLTVDEPTAFASYTEVIVTILVLLGCVIALVVIHLLALMSQTRYAKKKDKSNLHCANYISQIQRTLLNAHANPDMIDQALKIIAKEVDCESVLLLSFADKTVNDVHYWPSQDVGAAKELMGKNIRKDFPNIYDHLEENTSLFFDMEKPVFELSGQSKALFQALDIRNMIIVPVTDHSGLMKGVLCAVNIADQTVAADALECVTYDFFMTLTNVENIALIRSLGTMDYMTRVKNRNSYETELLGYATADCDSLWCMYIDVNGLHELNNDWGHKAGDQMLCAVADVAKRLFGGDKTYRLGGDEFLAFAQNVSEAEMLRRKGEMVELLSSKGYHVSVGLQGENKNAGGIFEIERMVAEAEADMYRDKRAFYEKNHLSQDRIHGWE